MKLGGRSHHFLVLLVGFASSSSSVAAFRIPAFAAMAASTNAASLQQFAPQAASLFNNMKTPASIISGAMVPLGLLAPVPLVHPDGEPEHRIEVMVRRSYTAIAILAMLSEFISIIFATVAVNQLTETAVAPAASVWDLLRRDYDLSWAGTNAHFLFGMFAFAYLIAVRSYFNVGGRVLGGGCAGLSLSAMLYMVGIVNRAVSSGGGGGDCYGKSVSSLFAHYAGLVLRGGGRFRPLEKGAVALAVVSLIAVVRAICQTPTGETG